MSNSRLPNKGQLSRLPGLTHYITGHNSETGQAIVQEERPASWKTLDKGQVSLHEVYVTSGFPPKLNGDTDIASNDQVLASNTLGLVHKGGIVCRIVDFAPQNEVMMHRTQSLDYGVVLEGSIEMVMDSDHVRTLHRGDVAIQRATMHGWRNPSEIEWTRMIFFMQHAEPLVVNGSALEEDLGRGTTEFNPSQ
ncbi:hypothetical protein BDV36DRAFT_306264 [Aspergillus pseudocaelatus]|uniref:Cupin 2 conserved barrel domain-containing protein n=1 Tax=Aspergillus pseudocaelatus TaxID=1825620 RepID=A0ABQ6WUJ9_9EURO|nr:hypothetical protein BDV36DRAFT_306264 [Aspergillus pseudocaelatus]